MPSQPGLRRLTIADGCPIATVTLEAAGLEPIRLTAERVFAGWLGALEDGLVAGGMEQAGAQRRALLCSRRSRALCCWPGPTATWGRCGRCVRS